MAMQRSLFPQPNLSQPPPEPPAPGKKKRTPKPNPYRYLTDQEQARILHKIKKLRIARAQHITDLGTVGGDNIAYPPWIRAIAFLAREKKAILKKNIEPLQEEFERFGIT